MTATELILKGLIVLLSIPAGYLLAVTIAAYLFRKENRAENRYLNIGVLIPAHNEEEGIRRTIKSVLDCDYPADRVEVYVIADNCTDRTAEVARSEGAIVAERTDTVNRGKGQALDWFLKQYLHIYHSADVITIIDADVTPDRNYLREVSASLSQPDTLVVQAYNGVSNPQAGWRPGLIDAAFNVFNHLRMAGSCRLSGTCVLKGNGMAFSTSLLERTGWPCHSIVEDMEFSLNLLQEEISVHYNPDAIIRSEMVTSGKNASSQRSRWEGGRFTLVRKMAAPLFSLFIKSRQIRFLIALAELATPPLTLLVMLFTLGTAASLLFLQGQWLLPAFAWWAILLLYVISGQIQRRAPLSTWMVLAAAPLYILWKIPLYAAMVLRKKSSSWVRTTREQTQQQN
jgi:cellulose synthase/poly-beta-1,6-N-acetylglucosamine synthase-like glycosyltransferase